MVAIKMIIVLAALALGWVVLKPIRLRFKLVPDGAGGMTKTDKVEAKASGSGILGELLILIVALIVVQGFGTVPTGTRGIVLKWSAATGQMKQPGLYWVMPIRDSVDIRNVQIQERTKQVSAASNDLQDVDATITVNYSVKPSEAATLYQEVTTDYRTTLIDPAIEDIVKANTANYNPEEMLQQRTALRDAILVDLRERLGSYFNITAVAVSNLSFSAQYTQSIEDKVIAEQRALEAENKLRQIEFEQQGVIEVAKAEAEKIRIQAEAITAQGGSEYVALQLIQQWDGHFPGNLVMGSEGGPFQILDVGNLGK